jgi:TM2 domain-containing membrane protein YozV
MNKKVTALLLSAFVLPGLGQLYLGRKMAGGILIALVNLVLLLALFVLLRGLSPVIAAQIAGGAISITPSEVMNGLDGATGFGKAVLAAFFLLWTFSVVDVLRFGKNKAEQGDCL